MFYDRQVNYKVAYVRIDNENSVAELADALSEFGIEDATWTVEPSYIVLSREMSTTEVPAVVGQGGENRG
ncbi:hypothetical protein [Microbacterium sp. XT11]|uniref:hypothetical protein n=1 Tax=Microbacterium sp. XT11 TaxID=367477 RepID=UPI000A7BB15A|nr:hypothetical protein [Microbacterium sp. XT11]